MARIPDHILDEIRLRLPVSEVVGRVVRLTKAGREFKGLSPFNKERTPSFFVNDNKMMWFDFSSNRNGTIFDFVMTTEGLTFPEAVEKLARWAGVQLPKDVNVRKRSPEEQRSWEEEEAARAAHWEKERKRRQLEDELDEAEKLDRAAHIIKNALPLKGTQGAAYFEDRGIPEPPEGWPDIFGFVPALYHDLEDRKFPAVTARVDDCVGEICAVWRIYLHPKLPKKAPIENAKLGLGNASGGAVRLGGVAEHIGTCEGVETGWGAWYLIGRRHPVWPTLSTAGMMNFEPPIGVARCDQFPDGDYAKRNKETGELLPDPTPAGRKAALAQRRRMDELGIGGVINPEPPPPNDYLDLWNEAKKYVET